MRTALDVVSPLSARVSAVLAFAALWVWFTIGLVFPDVVVRDVLDFGSVGSPVPRSYAYTCSPSRSLFPRLCALSFHCRDWMLYHLPFHTYSSSVNTYIASVYTSIPSFPSLLSSFTRLSYRILDAFFLSPLAAILDACLPSSAHIKFCVMGNGLGCEPPFPRHRPSEFATIFNDVARFALSAGHSTSSFAGSIMRRIYSATSSPSIWFMLVLCFTVVALITISHLLFLDSPLGDDDLPTVTSVNKKLALLWEKLEATHKQFADNFDDIAGLTCFVVFVFNFSLLMLNGTFRDLCNSRHDQRLMFYTPPTTLDEFYCSYQRSEWVLEKLVLGILSLDLSPYLSRGHGAICTIGTISYCSVILNDIWVVLSTRSVGVVPWLITRYKTSGNPIHIIIKLLTIIFIPKHHRRVSKNHFPPNYELLDQFKREYNLGKLLGRGAFGCVHQARRLADGQKVAVKFISTATTYGWLEHPKWGLVPRDVIFMDELDHENIIKLIDVFRDDTYIYVVQELFGHEWVVRDDITGESLPNHKGRSLAYLLAHHHKLPCDLSLNFFKQLVSAVLYLHTQGMYHCDIKPDNILVDKLGNIRLIDFGGALMPPSRDGNGSLPESVFYCGTRGYMPLEILLAMGDEPSWMPLIGLGSSLGGVAVCIPPMGDVWALGVVLYEMVSGIRIPFRSRRMVRGGIQSVEARYGLRKTRTAAIQKVMPILSRCLEVDVLKRADIKEVSQLCSSL